MVTTQRSRGRGGGGQLDRLAFAFDDERVVANAGLLLASTLAGRLGIEQVVDETLDLGERPGAARPGRKLLTLVCSALVGGDSIDDAGVLRCGETQRVLGQRLMASFDAGDIARLRDSWQASLPGSPALVSDVELFAEARATVVAAVNRGLAGAQLEISMEPEPLRGYSLSPKLPDLLAFIYFALANVLVEESPLARCLECGGTFVVHDRRQRYCSERHASRARYRRFTDRNRLTTAS